MTKRGLIDELVALYPRFSRRDAEVMVNAVFESLADALRRGERIEIRGFGSFVVKHREARDGRNPRTGRRVAVAAKRVPFFKVGKELRVRVDGDDGAARQRRGPEPDAAGSRRRRSVPWPMRALWAPWRMAYIGAPKSRRLHLLHWRRRATIRTALVLAATDHAVVMLNRYPYANGHLMVAPRRHTADLSALDRRPSTPP